MIFILRDAFVMEIDSFNERTFYFEPHFNRRIHYNGVVNILKNALKMFFTRSKVQSDGHEKNGRREKKQRKSKSTKETD